MNYKKLVESLTPKENRLKNMLIAFLSGGTIGAISEILVKCFSVEYMLVIWIVLASFLTGLGVFDDIVDKFKMGGNYSNYRIFSFSYLILFRI